MNKKTSVKDPPISLCTSTIESAVYENRTYGAVRGRRLITASYSISLLKAAVHRADTFKGRGESRVQGLGIIWELSDLTFRKKGEDDR